MNIATKAPATVPAEEMERRVAEYRRLGHERHAPAHVVYHDEQLDCPWAGCSYRIAGINFQLDRQGDASEAAQWLAAWWMGPGLVARCPGCGRHVLFGLDGKRAVDAPNIWGSAVLGDDWHQKAHIVLRTV
jgi:hypothetical protein